MRDHGSEKRPRTRVRELHLQLPVDGDHALLKLLEEALETVAIRLESLERDAQVLAHAVDGLGEGPELVVEPGRQRAVEATLLDLGGSSGDAAKATGDE